MEPKIYIHTGFDRDQAWPIPSWVIEGGGEDETRPECSECSGWMGPRDSLWLEGYDEYMHHEDGVIGFYPSDSELIAMKEEVEQLSSVLSGTVPIPIRYSDWNQTEISPDARLNHEPRLGALEAIGVCKGATDSGGIELQTCPKCGALLGFYAGCDIEEGKVRPIRSGWDGSDFFSILGTCAYILTERAFSRLKSKGFRNITCQEIEWAPTR